MAKNAREWSLISGVYSKVPLRDKLHVFIRQKAVPWDILIAESNWNGSLLDYGCGHGVLLAIYRQTHPHLKLFGIDHDERKKNVVDRCLPEVKMVEANALTRQYPDFFDYAVICDMLYCNRPLQREKIISDIWKSLKPGGKLIIKETVSTPRVKYYLLLLHELIVMRILKLTKGEGLEVPSPDYYSGLLARQGFKVTVSKPVHKGFLHPHHLFACVK